MSFDSGEGTSVVWLCVWRVQTEAGPEAVVLRTCAGD